MTTKITAIAGGIGSGKSVVARMLRAMGRKVYDCDAEARRIMDHDPAIKLALTEIAGEHAVNADGTINRRVVADAVFSDSGKLGRLNALVHGAVRADIARWAAASGEKRVWIETALLNESRLDEDVTDVWHVVAPEDVRVERVMHRSAMTAEEVKARIAAQTDPLPKGKALYTLLNDNVQPLLPQVVQLL